MTASNAAKDHPRPNDRMNFGKRPSAILGNDRPLMGRLRPILGDRWSHADWSCWGWVGQRKIGRSAGMKTGPPRLRNFASRLAKRGFNRFAKHVRPLVANISDYLFAEMDYVPEGWRGNASIADSWSDQAIADAQERHWPTLVHNLAGTGPLG